jgi:hypothetical protein
MDRLKLSTFPLRKSTDRVERRELEDLVSRMINRVELYHGRVKTLIIEFEDGVVEINEG